jgi:hypothetical protein
MALKADWPRRCRAFTAAERTSSRRRSIANRWSPISGLLPASHEIADVYDRALVNGPTLDDAAMGTIWRQVRRLIEEPCPFPLVEQ